MLYEHMAYIGAVREATGHGDEVKYGKPRRVRIFARLGNLA
jgi:hypothetical protein